MQALQITGMKISSPAPSKKFNSSFVQTKPKQYPKPNAHRSTAKKPSLPVQQSQKTPVTAKKQSSKIAQKATLKEALKKGEEKPITKTDNGGKQTKQQQIIVQKVQETTPVLFEVVVRYNHYKQKFPCINNTLNFSTPNEKYCFGLVFKGNYQPILRHFKTRQIIQPLTKGKADEYSWRVQEGQVYECQIQQDQEEQSKYQKHVYKAPQKSNCPIKRNHRVEALTNQMKNMGIQQLGGQKHRQLLEQRDLQDILFS